MKRCPECRRDYYDDTLLYCLDDGNLLLEGPATTSAADEPQTAILHVTDTPSEANTQAQIRTTDRTAVLPATGVRTPSGRIFSRPLIIGLAAVLVAGAALAYYKFASPGAVVSFEGAKIERATDSGELVNSVISPDGKWLVYILFISNSQTSVWLQQVGVAGSRTEIVKSAEINVQGLAFSPDSKYVYYTVREKADDFVKGALYQIPVIGGTAKKVLTGIDSKAAFSPDGKRLVYYYFAPGKDQTTGSEWRLMIANADGSEQRQLTARGGNEALEDPAWSPDGKSIVSVHGTSEPRVRSLVTVSPETGEITPFNSGKFQSLDDPVWLADGKSVLVLATEKTAERGKIWQVSYPSGEARKVSTESNNPGISYAGLSLSDDSSLLATTQYTETSVLWIASANDPTAATELKLGSDLVGNPAWTPDGKLVFAKLSGDARELNIIDPQAGEPKQLTSTGENGGPDVTPDGRYIVFTSARSGNGQLWRIDINGDNPKQLTTTGFNFNASISPDGREVYYTCNLNMVEMICKVATDGGEPVQVTKASSDSPQISADGKWILCFYREKENERAKIAIIPAGGGAPIKTFPIPDSLAALPPRWMPGDRSFFYSATKERVGNLWVQPIDGGPPKQYTNFTSQYLPWADFSRDGKIVYRRGTLVADVVLISGFKK